MSIYRSICWYLGRRARIELQAQKVMTSLNDKLMADYSNFRSIENFKDSILRTWAGIGYMPNSQISSCNFDELSYYEAQKVAKLVFRKIIDGENKQLELLKKFCQREQLKMKINGVQMINFAQYYYFVLDMEISWDYWFRNICQGQTFGAAARKASREARAIQRSFQY